MRAQALTVRASRQSLDPIHTAMEAVPYLRGSTARAIAAVCLCVLLVGATLWYLRDSPLFLGPYFVLSCLGFITIRRRGSAGLPTLNVAVICIQATALVVFAGIAVNYRIQAPAGPVGIPLPDRFVLPPWYRSIFFGAVIVILGLFGLDSAAPAGKEAAHVKVRFPWAVLLALIIQDALMRFWSLSSVDAVVKLSSPGHAPVGPVAGMAGFWLFGSPSVGMAASRMLALTGVLALVGATLSSLAVCVRVAQLAKKPSGLQH